MRLEGVRGVVLDLDGTVYDDRGLMPGAAEAVMAIRSARLGLRFATNTSRYPRGALVERLRSGVHAGLDDVITAPRAAASWLADHGLTRISLHVAAATVEEFAAFAIDERSPQAVVLGDLGDGWSVERLNRVFRHVLGGARLLAIQKNRYWMRSGSLCLDAGPFVAAIEYATGVTAFVAGKPEVSSSSSPRRGPWVCRRPISSWSVTTCAPMSRARRRPGREGCSSGPASFARPTSTTRTCSPISSWIRLPTCRRPSACSTWTGLRPEPT